jgi:hypothetical protein
VLTDLAVAIADGATAITDLRVMADQPNLFGRVASAAAAWRALGAIDADALARIELPQLIRDAGLLVRADERGEPVVQIARWCARRPTSTRSSTRCGKCSSTPARRSGCVSEPESRRTHR